jgi:hypothetical protein
LELCIITARGHWLDQKQYGETNGKGPEGERIFDAHPLPIHTKFGLWQNVQDVPHWPLGVTLIRYHYINFEWQNLADVLDSFVRVAKATLRSKAGVAAYLTGSPLYFSLNNVYV